MKGYLLDTNVLSEVLRKRPSPVVLEHLRAVRATLLFTSAICVMELRFGAARHPTGELLWARIARDALSRVTVLALDEAGATRAGELLAKLEARGERIGVEDVLIAATALSHGLAVVTRNLRHLSRVDELVVENWWE